MVPGQEATPRYETLDRLFDAKTPVDGIVHVVCNGFATVRNPFARETLARDTGLDTLEAYRSHQLGQELEDLDRTCELLRAASRKARKPAWMLVAVTKADLYEADLMAAQRYYSPHGQSEFAARIARLVAQLGSDNFRWSAAPVCASLEDFEWNAQTARSALAEPQRDQVLATFAEVLENYCAG